MDFTNFNFNLLVLFDALYRYRNGTHAAKSLGLAQSNLSRSLQELRDTFGDPLFVRSSHGMAPTDRAHQLAPLINAALQQLEAVYSEKKFDLQNAKGRMRIATTDYMEVLLCEGLVQTVLRDAPGLTISFRPLTGEFPKESIERGEIDIAMASYFGELPGGFYRKTLFEDPFVLLVREGHPLHRANRKLDAQSLTAFPYTLISTRGDLVAGLDRKLQSRGMKRHIAHAVPNSLSAVWTILHSDLCLVAAEKFATHVKRLLPIAILELPIKLEPLEMAIVWHERTHRDPFNKWLRGHISKSLNISP